jgi:hypothetical protein
MQSIEKERMEAHILNTVPETECEVFNMDALPADFRWEKKDKIFTINGIMFDVSKKKIINGSVYLYCIKEKKEMEILQDLTLKVSSDDYTGKPLHLSISQECILTGELVMQIPPPEKDKINKTIPDLLKRFNNIIIPPPRPCQFNG